MKKAALLIAIIFAFIFSLISFNLSYSQNIDKATSAKIQKYFQEKGEVYFKFKIFSRNELNTLTRIISIDNVKGFEVYAYANEKEFNSFKSLGYSFELLPSASETATGIKMADNIDEVTAWDVYPTYDQYVAMMNAFQTNYPNICKLYNIGTTASGTRALYFIKITDSVNIRKPKPRFMFTSSIHGDEITAYVLMLRLIDTLSKGYGVNPQMTNLLQNVEIWINPLANPDGTYNGGNNTVAGAKRGNANNVDMNRNYPDPAAGPHPDGNAWQPETICFMNFSYAYYFNLSMNFHGGAQVLNYPWDTWSRYHADDAWFIHVSKHFVDTIHAIAPSYMIDNLGYPNIPGIVNGYAWYRITGGRQDYMTYFRYGREITDEISSTKMPAASTLPTYWNNNFKSFMYYMKESTFGIRGIISDSITGAKLKAKVFVQSHDIDSAWVYSDSVCGNYHRMIVTGTYNLIFSAPGYYTKTINNVYTKNDSSTILNVQLKSTATGTGNNQTNLPVEFNLYQNYPNPFNPITNIAFDVPYKTDVTLKIYDYLGREITTLVNTELEPGRHTYNWNSLNYSSGVYFYKLTVLHGVLPGGFTRSSTVNFIDTKRMVLIK